MELTLEAVALFALKLVHEEDGGSPVLRDDLVMDMKEQPIDERSDLILGAKN